MWNAISILGGLEMLVAVGLLGQGPTRPQLLSCVVPTIAEPAGRCATHLTAPTLSFPVGQTARRSAFKSTVLGAVIGAAVGAFGGYEVCRHTSSFANDSCTSGMLGGGVLGAGLGALIGYSIGQDAGHSARSH